MGIQIDKLTSKELEILLILWNYGSATVKTIIGSFAMDLVMGQLPFLPPRGN